VDPRNPNEDAVTRTVLQNTEVLAAGQKTEQQDNKPITVQAVTLLVSPDGAETLALALHEGKVHLVLRNPEDQAETKVASLSTNEMLVKQAAAPVHVAAASRRAAPYQPHAQVASAPRQPGKVRIIRSANVSETPAVTDSTAN